MTNVDWFQILMLRVLAVVTAIGILVPPDAQNPHAWGDGFLAISAGFLWFAGDYLIHSKQNGRS